ncbi:MAG TPA: 2-C-methyl-D-erythritol 4-phosphate cytidylyltransferase [Ktedonobacteraceae bacterium]|nr:2-C-methyl-D-erythritol 4-phosphate cytidylyltransferase [Ktedonobacteraceae bacterium]
MTRKQSFSPRVVAVVLGAGQGTRMGRSVNKVFLPINGKPVIVYAIEVFEHCAAVDDILLVAAADEEDQLARLAHAAQCHKVFRVVQGGATRHASEQCALEALRPHIDTGEIEIILIHDGARPFISSERVELLIKKARELGGAILAAPLPEEEHIIQVDGEQRIQRTFTEEQIWRAQTPQAFQARLLLKAYDQAYHDSFVGTDTAASLERIGYPVAVVMSDPTNIKITTAHDLLHAERLSHHQP